MTIYERYCLLKSKRNEKDSDVAKATGIGKSTFSDWKSGRSTPKQEKLKLIADHFDVSIDYLLGKDLISPDLYVQGNLIEVHPVKDTMSRELVRYFEMLPDDLRQNVLDFVKATAKGYGDRHDS